MNEYEIECEVCEITAVVYVDSPDDESIPAFCPMCSSPLTPPEVNDV